MKTRRNARTYLGQKARIVHVATTSYGRRLYALKTCATRPIATAWDDEGLAGLHRYAAAYRLDLQNEGS